MDGEKMWLNGYCTCVFPYKRCEDIPETIIEEKAE